MLYYDPQVSGQFWLNMPLDAHFANTSGAWGAMRSSWTNTNGIYVAMKSSGLQGHQTHGNLDAGTFVLDALGQRFAGELGNGNYLATGQSLITSSLIRSQRLMNISLQVTSARKGKPLIDGSTTENERKDRTRCSRTD